MRDWTVWNCLVWKRDNLGVWQGWQTWSSLEQAYRNQQFLLILEGQKNEGTSQVQARQKEMTLHTERWKHEELLGKGQHGYKNFGKMPDRQLKNICWKLVTKQTRGGSWNAFTEQRMGTVKLSHLCSPLLNILTLLESLFVVHGYDCQAQIPPWHMTYL